MIWRGGNSTTVCCPEYAFPTLWAWGNLKMCFQRHQESLLGCALSNTPQFEIAALEFDPVALLGPAILSSICSHLRKVPTPFCCVSFCVKLTFSGLKTDLKILLGNQLCSFHHYQF